jgi:hypothetical protein
MQAGAVLTAHDAGKSQCMHARQSLLSFKNRGSTLGEGVPTLRGGSTLGKGVLRGGSTQRSKEVPP